MRYSVNRYILGLFLTLWSGVSVAQSLEPAGSQWTLPEQLGQPKFELQITRRLSDQPEMAHIDVEVQVLNDFLQFVRSDSDKFEASVEISFAILAKGKGEIQRQIRNLTQTSSDYMATNSRHEFISTIFTIEQPPGDYSLKIILQDKESGRKETIDRDITLKSYPKDMLSLSDLSLMKSAEFDRESRLPALPITKNTLSSEITEVYLFFDVFRPDVMSQCDLRLEVTNADSVEIFSDSLAIAGGNFLTAHAMPISLTDLNFGQYRLVLTGRLGAQTAVKTLNIKVNSSGLPGSIRNLDEAIDQLRYIATDNEIEAIKNHFSSEREQAFLDFWNEKFPVDGDKSNGKLIEYYNRINFANEHFSGATNGWETDRGRVLVIYGKPSEIESNVFEQDGVPYEIWYYNNLGKRFTFRDEYGFGDFRLVTPLW